MADEDYRKPDRKALAELREQAKADHLDLRSHGAVLRNLSAFRLHYCCLRDMTFSGTSAKPLSWTNTLFHYCDVDGVVFDHVDLSGGGITLVTGEPERVNLTFRCCNLQRVQFQFGGHVVNARFYRCDMRRAALSAANIRSCLHFVRSRGLWGHDRVSVHGVSDQETTAVFHHRLDFPTWARLQVVGSTRLMSVSWFGVIGLVAYAGLLRWYNNQITAFQDNSDGGVVGESWAAHLKQLPVPGEFGWLLLSIISIALAATIFVWRCPDVVKLSSRLGWSTLSGKQDMEYQGAAYDRWVARWSCAVGYSCGLYAVYYLIGRIVRSVHLFLFP